MLIEYIQSELKLRITIHSELIDNIKKVLFKHYPKEFGGVFIGTVETDFKIINIEDIIIPQEYSNNRFYFKRFSNFINEQLRKIFKNSKGQKKYLGEWHSHPDGQPIPSQKDLDTILKIATNKKAQNTTPIFAIIKINKNAEIQYNFYIYYKQNYYKYEKNN